MNHRRVLWLAVAAFAAFAALAAIACGSPSGDARPAAGFATGPAVLVPADYQAPHDRVDTTGAYLPANGKPTLVFVDAIW